MADVTFYTYSTTGSGPDYSVNSGDETGVVSVVVQDLSPGDEFVVNGQIYQYIGGADSGGHEVGFFAENITTHTVSFYSPTPVSYLNPENLVLNTSQSDWTCFMAGTHIATPGGSVNVEDLSVGDLVLTAEGKLAPIKWVGRQTVSTIFANPNRALPIRIRAGALDEAVPARDLLVSPCHAIFVDGVLVQAGALVNGSTIVRETDVPTTFVYYHIELDDHSLILAEGVPAETFVDNVDRLAFDNWDEHLQRYPNGGTIKELPYPRAASARQVPSSIVRRLSSRACALAGPLRAAS